MTITENLDLTNLDDVLARHPFEFQSLTDKLPEAKRKASESKLFLERTESSLYLSIRSALESSGEKFTEGKITAMVKTHEAYMNDHKNYLNAKLELDKIEQAKEAMLQQESSLKILSHLYGAQYWSLNGLKSTKKIDPPYNKKGDKWGKSKSVEPLTLQDEKPIKEENNGVVSKWGV